MTGPKIRLIALDIDGTLVDDEKNVPAPNLRALNAAREMGVHVAIASGRMIPSIEIVQDRLGLDCCLIAYNGGKVVGSRADGRRVVSHSPLPAEVFDRLVELTVAEGRILNVYLEDRLFCDRSHEGHRLPELYARRTGSRYEFTDIRQFRGREATKLIILEEPRERDRLYAELSEKLGDEANVQCTEPEYLEFMAPGIDKATALPALANYVGCEVEEILAVGDADNDREMLRTAGVGVAVANARPGVLQAAPFRTERTNNEAAVAEAVERWVTGAREDFWAD